ncbi:MAG TPA: hypothetical protein VIV60_36495, partial [Polyangiaceae bacterium]
IVGMGMSLARTRQILVDRLAQLGWFVVAHEQVPGRQSTVGSQIVPATYMAQVRDWTDPVISQRVINIDAVRLAGLGE